MPARSTLQIKVDTSGIMEDAVRALLKTDVVVGVPDKNADRKPTSNDKQAASNAVIAYTQEFGSAEHNIPPRPFLVPGLESVKPEIIAELVAAGVVAMNGANGSDIRRFFERIGLIGQNAVKAKITDGPFAPLSPRTIQERAARGRKGAKQYLKLQAQGVPVEVLNDPGVGLVKPLIDSGQLRNSVTYVVRDRGAK